MTLRYHELAPFFHRRASCPIRTEPTLPFPESGDLIQVDVRRGARVMEGSRRGLTEALRLEGDRGDFSLQISLNPRRLSSELRTVNHQVERGRCGRDLSPAYRSRSLHFSSCLLKACLASRNKTLRALKYK